MKLALAAAVLLSAAAVYAAETFTRPSVLVPVLGFTAELRNGIVYTSWHRYKRDDFKGYRVVKSSAKDDPRYPDDQVAAAINDIGTIRFEDGKLTPGTWRYRVVLVTVFGDRWMSPVATVVIKPEDIARLPPTADDFETP